ncbi:glycosyltransferase [Microscilla marina]|uniref:Glycosyl transferase, group 1 family protein n=1 Tax=Microscilla marina ATCC 23134 TaxID=313606 RepID=A1ZI93_MICM2|nr:glycosyltransferase [Microscilla marina]EAY29761.1 glycosyl transferase, group 1 family protein [Microscilla marina ATCC 23134]
MKIAFLGNVANNFYVIVKALRQHSDIDAHLYLGKTVDYQERPENEDPELKNNYPTWIHSYENWDAKNLLKFWDKKLPKELSTYDAVVLSSVYVGLAPSIKTQTIFFVTGGDLTVTPFPYQFSFLYKSIPKKLKAVFLGQFQKRGIKKVNNIWTQPFFPFKNALQKLSVQEEQVKHIYFPLIIDTDVFKEDKTAHSLPDHNIKKIADHFNFVLFHPSRLMINPNPNLKETGQWKQNDLLLKAFAHFIKKNNIKDASIAMPDRTASPDVDTAKQLIQDLGIEQNVVWLKANNPEGFTRNELIKFYSIADVVSDDFGIGWFGSIVLEAFAIGKPVVSYVDEQVMKELYDWHPILSSNTVEGVSNYLEKLYFDKEYAHKQGLKGKEWINAFHSKKSATHIYVNQFVKMFSQ